jgi:hypothetical protein
MMKISLPKVSRFENLHRKTNFLIFCFTSPERVVSQLLDNITHFRYGPHNDQITRYNSTHSIQRKCNGWRINSGGKKKTSLETKVYWLCHVAPGLSARQLELLLSYH